MDILLKYVGSALVAAALAVILTLYVFQMSMADAVQTGLLASAVAVVIVYLNTRGESATETGEKTR